MVKTTEEVLSNYKKALRKYKREDAKFLRECKRSASLFIHGVDDEHLNYRWGAVDAVAKALGLTKTEKEAAMRDAGLKNES